ncbi:MAG: radical SAM protein [Kosmotoga sp.]|jgi:putative pyruvate formate lyase activating enzyme|nr:MAG: radical SAM protein [Kosmotoga sp.]
MRNYIDLVSSGKINDIEKSLMEHLNECRLCPRECGVNRYSSAGICMQMDKPRISNVVKHFGEEPPLVKNGGSGTVFFSGCTMKCVYCQNFGISQKNYGNDISIEELARIFLDLQNSGAENINLVTPTPHLPFIISALKIAANNGLVLPIVYNTSGYEKFEILKLIDGIVDIYLPDIRYTDDNIGKKYSKVSNYWTVTRKAIKEMFRQVGAYKEDLNKGLIIRHLVLPEGLAGTEEMAEFVSFELAHSVPISLMSQYRPVYKAKEHNEIARRITDEEYREALNSLEKNYLAGWMQHFTMEEGFRVKPIRRR